MPSWKTSLVLLLMLVTGFWNPQELALHGGGPWIPGTIDLPAIMPHCSAWDPLNDAFGYLLMGKDSFLFFSWFMGGQFYFSAFTARTNVSSDQDHEVPLCMAAGGALCSEWHHPPHNLWSFPAQHVSSHLNCWGFVFLAVGETVSLHYPPGTEETALYTDLENSEASVL